MVLDGILWIGVEICKQQSQNFAPTVFLWRTFTCLKAQACAQIIAC